MEQQEQNAQPQLCASGCGFFSNVGTEGMCSKCYRESQTRQQQAEAIATAANKAVETQQAAAAAAAEAPAAAASMPAPMEVDPAPAATPAAAAAAESVAAAPAEPAAAAPSPAPAATPESASKGPTRCNCCRKKVGLTGFKCKCGLTFCGQHRYAEAHACTFDWKGTARALLAEANPLVQAAKVEKI